MTNLKKRSNFADVAVISLGDFERIKNTTKAPSKNDELNNKAINDMQFDNTRAKGKNLKDRIIEIDKNRTDKVILSDLDKENLEKKEILKKRAIARIESNYDEVKDMNKLVLYSKVAGIRERQLDQSKKIKEDAKLIDKKMDLKAELDRLRLLEKFDEEERGRKEANRQGALIIKDQMKHRIKVKDHEKEVVVQEGLEMKKKIQELEQEEKQRLIDKKVESDKLALEVAEFNKKNEGKKDRIKKDERDLDLRMLKYQLDLAKKEEDDIAEKK